MRIIPSHRQLSALCALLAALALLSGACAAAPPIMPQTRSEAPRGAVPAAAPAAPASGAAQSAAGNTAPEQPVAERMIIRNVSLLLVVADVDAALAEITRATTDVEGYVVSAESSESNGERYGKATLRVPGAKLDDTLARIKRVAQRVRRETANAKDVTEEFVDQGARLRVLRATETQYLEILRNARTIEDTLKVQQAVSGVREQIERTEGRLQFLQRSVELATISVELTTSAAAARAIEGGEWSFEGTAMSALQLLVDVAQFLAQLAIYVVVLTPLWLPFYLLFRWWRRRRAKRRAAVPPAPAAGTS